MSTLKPLVMMQLKDKLDFSFLKSKKQTIFKIVFSLLKFAVLTAIIYFAFYFVSALRLVSLKAGIPTSVFSIVFGIMVILSIIVCTFGLTKSLYLSKDNQFLLTMPVSRVSVFISKFIVYFIYEFKRNCLYILPLLFAFGLINAMPIWFFLMLPINVFIITMLTVSLGALFSVPLLFIIFLLRRAKFLEYALIVVFIGGLITAIVLVIGLIPQNINLVEDWGTIYWDIQDMLTKFTQTFAGIYLFTVGFVGFRDVDTIINQYFCSTQGLSMLVIIAIILAVCLVTFFIVKPIFFKMASKPFEYTKKQSTHKFKNKQLSPFWGSLKKEVFINFRTSDKFNNLIITAIVLPISILLLNKIFGAMDTRLTGTYMTMAFNVLLILLISLASNDAVARIFSEEGASSYLNKTMPQSYGKILTSKLIIPMCVMLVSIITACIIFAKFAGLGVWAGILTTLSLCLIYLGHLFQSATLDIMNPQSQQYATLGMQISNPNELKSTLLAFIISALITFIYYFLMGENATTVTIKLLIIAAVFCVWNVYMYFTKIKVYYKEK